MTNEPGKTNVDVTSLATMWRTLERKLSIQQQINDALVQDRAMLAIQCKRQAEQIRALEAAIEADRAPSATDDDNPIFAAIAAHQRLGLR